MSGRRAPEILRCRVAVVGSGPGGAITACLLAEAGRDVLLLEEGAASPAWLVNTRSVNSYSIRMPLPLWKGRQVSAPAG